jgi:hypothetical protein
MFDLGACTSGDDPGTAEVLYESRTMNMDPCRMLDAPAPQQNQMMANMAGQQLGQHGTTNEPSSTPHENDRLHHTLF